VTALFSRICVVRDTAPAKMMAGAASSNSARVMFPYPEGIKAYAIRSFDLFQQVCHPL
jgi:hypothetical protein